MKSKIFNVVCAVLIFSAVVLFNAYILFWISHFFPSLIALDSKLQSHHQLITRYILWDQNADLNSVLDSSQAAHINDVKVLVQKIPILVVILGCLIFLLKKLIKVSLKTAVSYSVILTVTFILTSFFFFMPFFIKFHQVFFPQGNWEFPTDSVLITLYPENLWLNATIALFCLTIFELLITRHILKPMTNR